IATYRKLQAMGMLVSEMTVTESAAGERTASIRPLIAQAIPLAGAVLIGLTILVLSSAILPALNVLLLLLLIVGFTGWLSWRSMVKVYAKAQLALRETLSKPPLARGSEEMAPFRSFLKEVSLKSFAIQSPSTIAGQRVRELGLRSKTGASIVVIERKGETIINPGPEEKILLEDSLLLLGTEPQLDAAQAFLEAESPSAA
ncbi:MAG TPA: TrkA C-terminal domain-containing protein, partial [Candidatus Saccharimonadales bacterium]|nr:TrkA C-terminal domain-containing protein [Candidatus Saccharimonadales bacterium]